MGKQSLAAEAAWHAGPRLPPGPRGVPLLGSLPHFGRDQLGFFSGVARDHGDLAAFRFGGWPCLLLGASDDIERVLVKEADRFIKNRLIWRHVTAVFGQGLLTAEGKAWQRNRRLVAPAFAGPQLAGYAPAIQALTDAMLGNWRDGDIRDLHLDFMGLTLRIAAKTLMDAEVEQDIADMDHAVNELTEVMEARFKRPFAFPDWAPLPGNLRYRRAIATGERVITRMIAQRRAEGIEGRTDFLSRLMRAAEEAGAGMSDRQLRDETLTMLLAGHETTALALSWSVFHLGRHPGLGRRMAAEVAEKVGERDITADDVQRLSLVESVILEAMRLHPPAWVIGRESVTRFTVGAYEFEPGTTVFISPWVLHRDPHHFEAPDQFRPERWLDGLARRLPRFAYMPFGGGPRICVGQRFAMMEAVMILAAMVRRFEPEGLRDRTPTPFPSITLRPRGGVWAKLSARRGVPH